MAELVGGPADGKDLPPTASTVVVGVMTTYPHYEHHQYRWDYDALRYLYAGLYEYTP